MVLWSSYRHGYYRSRPSGRGQKLGWFLIISGVLQAIGLIGAREVPYFWLALISAVLAIVIGLLLLRHTDAGLLFFSVLFIVYFMLEGIVKTIFALSIRPFPIGVGCSPRPSLASHFRSIFGPIFRRFPSGMWASSSGFCLSSKELRSPPWRSTFAAKSEGSRVLDTLGRKTLRSPQPPMEKS